MSEKWGSVLLVAPLTPPSRIAGKSDSQETLGGGALWANSEAHTPFGDKNVKKEKYQICKLFYIFSESL